jgi:hypothetical protein
MSFGVSPSQGNTEHSPIFKKNRTNENVTTLYGYAFISRIIHARNHAKKTEFNQLLVFLNRFKVIFPFGVTLFYGSKDFVKVTPKRKKGKERTTISIRLVKKI